MEVQLKPPSIEPNPSDTHPLLQTSSIEINNNDQQQSDIEVAESSAACCRICLEYNGESDLISPCMCKGTQQFVHRSCLDHWRSVKVISLLGGFAYLMDRNGNFRNSFSDGWDRVLSKHPIPFYYCIGVVVFFAMVGLIGLIIHCTSSNCDPCPNHSPDCYCYMGDCVPASSTEACLAVAIIFVIIFAMVGLAYGFFAATMAIQSIWQKHYHILTKIELTKEYVVVDLAGGYTPPNLDPEHEERLKLLKLL
ncbi:hypothetical protein AQUCO_00100745v1 [Aquilegia coerulea]|uniref:RING-CH-type domain-containing protein n=1 Tax=Aquilegia coerulea TaxID=218851 RepID=A0A2G5FBZ3_AQUCA|nr:hypothetical protein AQUCO_00100745v1 [Aquilegia coerulea]